MCSKDNLNNINEFFFKRNQMPDMWFHKAYRLYRDANKLYEIFEKERIFLCDELEKEGFSMHKDGVLTLEEYINRIYRRNPNKGVADLIPDFRSFYLLVGFCLENVLKGIIVSQNIEIIGSEKLHSKLKQHNLNKLIEIANINLTKKQLMFLEKISDFIMSYGRYPTKTICRDYKSVGHVDIGDIDLCAHTCDCITNPYKKDKCLFENIYKTLEKHMETESLKYDVQMKTIFTEEYK